MLGDLGDLGVDLRVGVGGGLVAPLRDDERADLLAQIVDLLLEPRVLELLFADRGRVLGLIGGLARRVLDLVENPMVRPPECGESRWP